MDSPVTDDDTTPAQADPSGAARRSPGPSPGPEPGAVLVYGREEEPGCWNVNDLFGGAFDLALGAADALVVLDPLSFAWEAYRGALERRVVYFVAPRDLSPGDLILVFGGILDRLTFFDRIVATIPEHFQALDVLGLAGCQRILIPEDSDARDWSQKDYRARNAAIGKGLDPAASTRPDQYWRERGARFGFQQPDKSVCSIRHSVAENKLMHVEQMRALRPLIEDLYPDRQWAVVEFGCGTGRVLNEFRKSGAVMIGVDVSEALLGVCQSNLPSARLIHGRICEVEGIAAASCDLALFVTVFHHLDVEEKRAAIRAALSAVRQGGHILFLEDHVASALVANAITRPMGVDCLGSLLSELSFSGTVLEHFETVAYSHLDEVRTGLSVFRKIVK